MTREEVIKYGKEQLDVFGGKHAEFIKSVIELLEQEKVGEWIVDDNNPSGYSFLCYCSNCKEYYTLHCQEMDYCPNCGAKMKMPQIRK